jgi:putative tryptophan/tyrosine transport system substrate-binding protein
MKQWLMAAVTVASHAARAARRPGDRMRLALGLMLLAISLLADAQQAKKATIGFLSINSRAAMEARVAAFRQGLREHGYVEGKNILVEYRYADAKGERLTALAAELVKLKVSVIVTEGTSATRYAKEATSTIPIVMAQDPDPVGTGFVVSLSRPGGNITGLANLRAELSGKRFEILKEALPGITRVLVIGTSITPGVKQELEGTQIAAERLGVKVHYVDARSFNDVLTAFNTAAADGTGAVVTLAGPFTLSYRKELAALALKTRLPTIYYTGDFIDDGGLMSYGVVIPDLFRRSASYVDRILKGAKPADLPVERPTKVELVVNLKTAKQMGMVLPPSLLLRTDRVVE